MFKVIFIEGGFETRPYKWLEQIAQLAPPVQPARHGPAEDRVLR